MSDKGLGGHLPSAAPEISVEPIPAGVAKALESRGVDLSAPQVRETVTILAHYFAGPIPPPELLAAYSRINPDLPDRIIGWVEQQRDHRQARERETTQGEQWRLGFGQILGFVVAMSSLGGAVWIQAISGSWLASVGMVIAGVGGPSAATVMAKFVARHGSGDPPKS
jgi:uncharacterized membrane protein